MPVGQGGDLAGGGVELGTVAHDHMQGALKVVLEVRCLAQVGAGQGLDVL